MGNEQISFFLEPSQRGRVDAFYEMNGRCRYCKDLVYGTEAKYLLASPMSSHASFKSIGKYCVVKVCKQCGDVISKTMTSLKKKRR